MKPLKISVTGVRGVVGETFTPHLVVHFAEAFGTYAGGGRVFICDDARRSAAMVRSAALSGLLASGCEPVDFGTCPTPSMQFALAAAGASGGIAVSAGHNPEEWNALRFIRSDGMYLNALQGDALLDIFHAGEFTKTPWDSFKKIAHEKNPFEPHLKKIIEIFGSAAVKKRGFRVAVDTCNGACSEAAPRLLEMLGCKVIAIHTKPGDPFPHAPEPSPRNMETLRTVTASTGCDAGFMLDTAGERLGIVTDTGEALEEELTLPLCEMLTFDDKPGIVVTNLSTTRSVEDVARKTGSRVIRTQIGQAYVAEAAMKNRAGIAGEGSGGIIIPSVQFNNDSLAAMAFILSQAAKHKARICELASLVPRYEMRKVKVPMDFTRIFSSIQKARVAAPKTFKNARFSYDDGVKIEWPDAWLHLRPSNTESLIRIIAEARGGERADKLVDAGMGLLE